MGHTFSVNGNVIQNISDGLDRIRELAQSEIRDPEVKRTVIEGVKEAKEAIKENNEDKLKSTMGKILQHGANVSQIASLAIQILSQFNAP